MSQGVFTVQRRWQASLSMLMVCLPLLSAATAGALDFDVNEAFVVDRCGGDYSCDDVELVLINNRSQSARIIPGQQDTSVGTDGAPARNNGYSFKDNTSTVTIAGSPPTITLEGRTSKLDKRPYLTLESDDVFIFLSTDACNVCGSLPPFFVRGINREFDAVVVDKKSLKVVEQKADVATICLKCQQGPGDTVAACRGEMRFSVAETRYVIAGDPCTDDQLKLTEKVDGVHAKISTLEDRPHAF